MSAGGLTILAGRRTQEHPRCAARSQPDDDPREIAEVLDVPSRNVRQLLFHMLRGGEAIAPWKTGYRIAE